MSSMKQWFENHISEFTDEELLGMGYTQEDIDSLRECFEEKGSDSHFKQFL